MLRQVLATLGEFLQALLHYAYWSREKICGAAHEATDKV